MAISNPPPDFVIRLGDVRVDPDKLADTLGQELDRHEPSKRDPSQFAQISMPGEAGAWTEVVSYLAKVGPRIQALIDQKLIGSACIDFAVSVRTESIAKFFTVPAVVAGTAGLHSIDIEVSIYAGEPQR